MFSLSRRLLLYWIHLLPMVRLCAFLSTKAVIFRRAFFSSHLHATPMAASAPGVLQGFGLAVLGLFSDFFQVQVPCEILDLVDHLQSQVWFVC